MLKNAWQFLAAVIAVATVIPFYLIGWFGGIAFKSIKNGYRTGDDMVRYF